MDAAEGTSLNPYHVLVSEAMCQQTQVATVVPYFERFLARFPTVQSLAESDLQDVLRLWQGLGYYSRAKNLRAAAAKIVSTFGGQVPRTVDELLTLPGVGRYTAGAICSIAFEGRAPILDGNVARVLCRLDCISDDPRDPAVREKLWTLAEEILPRKRLGDFNSAMMELGALVCTPRSPQCLLCPLQAHCEAFAVGAQERIPPPRKQKPLRLNRRRTFCIRHRNHYLIEQRPPTGRWAGMWQFPTLEHSGEEMPLEMLRSQLSVSIAKPHVIGEIAHALTHRRYEFEVLLCQTRSAGPIENGTPRRWVRLEDLDDFPLPRPHLKIAELLAKLKQ